ncbi:MAG: hypothetical protein AABY30_01460, partial [Candidatus Thermoplasmatota archaeon]
KYILVLSLLLWWLPTVGQMIAGYVGGRRAGGPWRGIVAAILPVLFIVLLVWGTERGLLAPWLGALTGIPAGIGAFVTTAIPPAAPFVQFGLSYLDAFVRSLQGTLALGSNGYLVTIVFAYIGGILADQSRREASVGRGTSVGINISQPLLAPLRHPFAGWGHEQPERFGDLRKIPVRAAAAASEAPREGRKPPKVETRSADSGPEEGPRPAGEPTAKPERKELTAHDKEVATRRFVERALRQYETAHRR